MPNALIASASKVRAFSCAAVGMPYFSAIPSSDSSSGTTWANWLRSLGNIVVPSGLTMMGVYTPLPCTLGSKPKANCTSSGLLFSSALRLASSTCRLARSISLAFALLTKLAGSPNKAPPTAPRPAAAPTPFMMSVSGATPCNWILENSWPPPSSTASLKVSPSVPLITPLLGAPAAPRVNALSMVEPAPNDVPTVRAAAWMAAVRPRTNASLEASEGSMPWLISSLYTFS